MEFKHDIPFFSSDCITCSIFSGFVQLGCLFFPKVHVVLFKPEKNTRDAVMTVTRNSIYAPGSSNRKQGHDHHSAPAIFVLTGELILSL